MSLSTKILDLINDATVREKKPMPSPPPEPPRRTFVVGTSPATTHVQKPRVVLTPRAPEVKSSMPSLEEITSNTLLDPDCEHRWQWKQGVQTCWLCGGPAPVDRRDNSTRWRG